MGVFSGQMAHRAMNKAQLGLSQAGAATLRAIGRHPAATSGIAPAGKYED